MNKNTIHFLFILFTGFSLIGCSQALNDLKDTPFFSSFKEKNIYLSNKRIQDLPFASIYAQIEGYPQVFMVLGFFSLPVSKSPDNFKKHFKLKWLSADHQMLVTEYGRIIKTVNLNGSNLSSSYSYQSDPLALGLLKKSTPKKWVRKVDWQPGNYIGYRLTSHFVNQGKTTLKINEKWKKVIYFIEDVTSPELDVTYQNHYWLHPESGAILASHQIPAPGMPNIKITLLKAFGQKGK